MLEKLIKNYLIAGAKVDPAKFDQPGLMVTDLGLDSLGLVEMLFEVEEHFGFQISDPMQFQNMRFSEMVAAIEAEVRENNHGELPDIASLGPSANTNK